MRGFKKFHPRLEKQTREQMIHTDLCKGHQIWHILEIVGREISVTSCLDFCQRLVNLRT